MRQGPDSFVDTLHEKPRDLILNNFGNRPERVADDGESARKRFDQDNSKRFRPVDGEEECGGIPQERVLLQVADLSNELDQFAAKHGFDASLEVFAVSAVDLSGDL